MSAGVAGLRRLLTTAAAPAAQSTERCDLCATEVPAEHQHLVHLVERTIRCACRACALLFTDRSDGYRTIPDRWRVDPAFTLSDAQWDALQVPVGLAFFLRSPTGVVTTCYPGPAGATESELAVDLDGLGPLAALMEPDVEALLVRRSGEHTEALLVPVDACYRLVGLVRTHWRGFDGGPEAWGHIGAFFDDARGRAREVRP